MSWSDIFYPDNPKRREEVINLSSQLHTFMYSNFDVTNDLIDSIHKHLPGKRFDHIEVKEDESIKLNCETIINTMNSITEYLHQKDLEVKEKLDPKIYEELKNVEDEKSLVKKWEAIQKREQIAIGVIATIGGLALIYVGFAVRFW